MSLLFASLESMYVTPDISGVEINFRGAVAQPLGARFEILCVAAQPLAWWRAVAHKKEILVLHWHISLRRKMCLCLYETGLVNTTNS